MRYAYFAFAIPLLLGVCVRQLDGAIQVSQGGVVQGSIDPFAGAMTGSANYNFFGDSGHPMNHPTPSALEAQIFLYDGSDGLNFTAIFGEDNSGAGTQSVEWNIAVSGSTTDPVVRLSDDTGELTEMATTNTFQGRWLFANNTDGGVIGEIGGDSWTLSIDPVLYRGINSLKIFDETGAPIVLNLSTDPAGNIHLTPISAVPEPPSFAVWCLPCLAMCCACLWQGRRQ